MAKAQTHHVEYTPPEPAMHFETLAKQNHAGRLGMWAFLCTEILLFAGLFALYAVYLFNAECTTAKLTFRLVILPISCATDIL